MDFWEDEGETDTKHDYRTRWNDLKNEYDETEDRDDETSDNEYIEEDNGSRRIFDEKKEDKEEETTRADLYKYGAIGWGEKMWKEVEDDWSKDGEKWKKFKVRKRKKEKPLENPRTDNLADRTLVSDDGARYLSAWADAGEILEPQHAQENRSDSFQW